jgi:hypothetical protein
MLSVPEELDLPDPLSEDSLLASNSPITRSQEQTSSNIPLSQGSSPGKKLVCTA